MAVGTVISGAACVLEPEAMRPPLSAALPLVLCSVAGYAQQIMMPMAFKYTKAATAAM